MSDDSDIDKIREFGRMMAPLLTVYVATQLLLVRLQNGPTSPDQRERIIAECLQDAVRILKVI